MESRKLTDEELIEIAKQTTETEEENDRFDIPYYQDSNRIIDGSYKVYTEILHFHYKKWSINPISLKIFHDMLKLKRKTSNAVFLDKKICNINLNTVIGAYVKYKKKREKEKRLRQISSIKPKT